MARSGITVKLAKESLQPLCHDGCLEAKALHSVCSLEPEVSKALLS
jgi:hypothetical protein